MEIEINLDAMAERYVRSMEARVEWHRARSFALTAAGFVAGFMTALALNAML